MCVPPDVNGSVRSSSRLPASGGADVLVGAISDPDLGPVLALGLGGRQAGLGQGAAFGLLPVTDAEADELIDSSEGVTAELDGFLAALCSIARRCGG